MRDRYRLFVACALGVVVSGAMGALSACNSLSGIESLVVGGDGAAAASQDDGTTGEGASHQDGSQGSDAMSDVDGTALGDAPASDGTSGDTGMTFDGANDVLQSADEGSDSPGSADATTETAADGAADVERDAASDATEDGPVDAGNDSVVVDAPVDAPASGPCDGGSPYVVHSNGFGQSFSDCQPLGTYNVNQAFEACAASTGDAGACSVNTGGLNCSAGNLVCGPSGSGCQCWRFDGHPGAVDTFAGACNCIPLSYPALWN